MESEISWLSQYPIEDLSRALIRQYFVQNRLTETLMVFEQEDVRNSKKITKSILIKMLSLATLFQQNKSQEKPHKSLVEILVAYLRNKFKDKVEKNREKQTTSEKTSEYALKPESNENVSTGKKVVYNQSQNSLTQREVERLSTGQTLPTKTKTASETNASNIKQKSFDKQSDQLSMFEDSKKKEGKKIEADSGAQQSNPIVEAISPQPAVAEVKEEKGGSRMGGMRKMGKRNVTSTESANIPVKSDTETLTERKPKTDLVFSDINDSKKPQISTDKKQQPLQTEKTNETLQKQEEGTKMVTMFGRKKKLANKQEENQPKKFQFDENFVDEPLHAYVKYTYEPINFQKITVLEPFKPLINYKQKVFHSITPANKKKPEKLLSENQAKDLKTTIFQNNSHILPKSWHQGFILSPFPATPYGLKQIQGGPCGIIAALQCYYLKHLLHVSSPQKEDDISNEIRRQICLVAAITDLLMKVKSSDQIYLTLPPRSFSGNKLDIANLTFTTVDAIDFKTAFSGIWPVRSSFIGQKNHGVTVMLYSIVATKGTGNIRKEIDCEGNPLIGNHGHCTQELVNLFITGKAISNCFDGEKVLEDNYKLGGIHQKAQFGFLTIYETLKYIEVGKNLKKPIYPFWIICKEFHYHVIFANNYLIGENDDAQKFDMVYYDGLYNCGDRIVITLEKYPFGQEPEIKLKHLPLIEQVMMTKWGLRNTDWNGSIQIL